MKTLQLNTTTLILAILFSCFQTSELNGQNKIKTSVRDHRTSASMVADIPTNRFRRTVRSQNTTAPKTGNYHPDSMYNQLVFFDEADALFGKRTSISEKSPAIKIKASVKTIRCLRKHKILQEIKAKR